MARQILAIQCDTNITTARGHNSLMRDLMREGAEHHRDKVLPGHFEDSAYRKYHYKPRRQSYVKGKLKKVGHNLPLVFSGRMRAEVLGRSKVTATKDRSRLYIRNYFPMRDEIRAELEAVLESERADFVKTVRRQYYKRIVDPQYARKRRRKP